MAAVEPLLMPQPPTMGRLPSLPLADFRGAKTPLPEQLSIIRGSWPDVSYRVGDLARVNDVLQAQTGIARLPLPYLFGDPDGLVRVEWQGARFRIVQLISPADLSADFLAVGESPDDEVEHRFDFTRPGDVWLAALAVVTLLSAR